MITAFKLIGIEHLLIDNENIYKVIYEHENERGSLVRRVINCLPVSMLNAENAKNNLQKEMYSIIAKSVPQTIVYHGKEWILLCVLRNNEIEPGTGIIVEFYLDGHLVSKIQGRVDK